MADALRPYPRTDSHLDRGQLEDIWAYYAARAHWPAVHPHISRLLYPTYRGYGRQAKAESWSLFIRHPRTLLLAEVPRDGTKGRDALWAELAAAPRAQRHADVLEGAKQALQGIGNRHFKDRHAGTLRTTEHLWVQVRYDGETALALWRLDIELLLPAKEAPRFIGDDRSPWPELSPLLRVTLAERFDFVQPQEQEVLAALDAALTASVRHLVLECLFQLDWARKELEPELAYEHPPVSLVLRSPAGDARSAAVMGPLALTLAEQVNLRRTGLVEDFEAYGNDLDEDAHIVFGSAHFEMLTSTEQAELRGADTLKPKRPAARQGGTPGHTLVLLEGREPGLVLTREGLVYPLAFDEETEACQESFGMSPRELCEFCGLDSEEYQEFAKKDHRSGPVHAWVESGRIDDYAGDFREHFTWGNQDWAWQLIRALRVVEVDFESRRPLVLRLLADKATDVAYAELCEPTVPLDNFLQRALGGAPTSPLAGSPACLQVARTLLREHPELEAWAQSQALEVTHPVSGFHHSAHVMRQWLDDMNRMDPRQEHELPDLAECNRWLARHAWVLGLASMGCLYIFEGHDTGASKVDGLRYYEALGVGSFEQAALKALDELPP